MYRVKSLAKVGPTMQTLMCVPSHVKMLIGTLVIAGIISMWIEVLVIVIVIAGDIDLLVVFRHYARWFFIARASCMI